MGLEYRDCTVKIYMYIHYVDEKSMDPDKAILSTLWVVYTIQMSI